MIFKVFYYNPKSYSQEAIVGEFVYDCLDDLMASFKAKGLEVLYAKESVNADEMREFKEKVGV